MQDDVVRMEQVIPTELQVSNAPSPDLAKSKNLAKNENDSDTEQNDLCLKVKGLAQLYLERFRNQRQSAGGWDERVKNADRMFRCGLNTAKNQAAQSTKTLANTASTVFFRACQKIHANLHSMIFSQDLPVHYKPVSYSITPDKLEEGKRMAEYYNALLYWTMRADNFELKCFDSFWELVKVANQPFSVTWLSVKKKIRERHPKRNADGTISGWEWVEVERVMADRPVLTAIDNRDFYADIQLDPETMDGTSGFEDHAAVLHLQRMTIDDLMVMHDAGEIANLNTIKTDALSQWDANNQQWTDRMDNMGMGQSETVSTNLYNVWNCWMMLPIDEKGKWDTTKNLPVRYWVQIVGSPDPSDGTVIRIERNPYPEDMLPFYMVHTFPDNTGLYHLGVDQLIYSTYNELTTCKNQLIDNKTMRNRAPMIGLWGSVRSKDLTYDKNKILWVDRLDALTPVKTDDTTGTTSQTLQYLEDDTKETLGSSRSFEGQPLGSRTSSQEAGNIYQQAMKPSLAQYRYIASQVLLPYARRVKALWNANARSDMIIEVTGYPIQEPVKPSELWGDYDVEVTVIDEFENTVTQRQNDIQFLQVVGPSPMAQKIDWDDFTRKYLDRAGYKDVKLVGVSDVDAQRVARLENVAIVNQGVFDQPQQGENHATHIPIHEAYRDQARLIADDAIKEGVNRLEIHIQAHKALQQQAAPQMAPGLPGGTPAGNPGEAAQMQLGAMMGGENGGNIQPTAG